MHNGYTLSGAFEFMMDNFVEWLLQDRDAEPSVQTNCRAQSMDP